MTMEEGIIGKVNNRIVNWLIREGSIDEEDRDVYEYGVRSMVERGISILSMLLIMIFSKYFIEGIVFILSFKLLRKYAGGYHADTFLKCFILSALSFFGVIMAVKYDVINIISYRILALVSFIILYIIKPVDSPNKPLTEKEKKIYYKYEKIIICIMMLLCFVMCVVNLTHVEKSVESAAILNGATSLYVVVRRRTGGSICM